MVTAQKASLVVDTKGTLCPIPIVKTSQAINQVKVGEVFEVLATDPGSKSDIPAWARMTGNELIDSSDEGDSPRVFKFQIRRLK